MSKMLITPSQALEAVQIIWELAEVATEGGVLAAELRLSQGVIAQIVDLRNEIRDSE